MKLHRRIHCVPASLERASSALFESVRMHETACSNRYPSDSSRAVRKRAGTRSPGREPVLTTPTPRRRHGHGLSPPQARDFLRPRRCCHSSSPPPARALLRSVRCTLPLFIRASATGPGPPAVRPVHTAIVHLHPRPGRCRHQAPCHRPGHLGPGHSHLAHPQVARSRISAGSHPGQVWRTNGRPTRSARARTDGAATDHPRHRPGPTSGPAGAHCHGSSPPPDRAQPRPGRRRHRSTPPLAWARLRPRCSHLTAPQAGPSPDLTRGRCGAPTAGRLGVREPGPGTETGPGLRAAAPDKSSTWAPATTVSGHDPGLTRTTLRTSIQPPDP